MNRANIPRMLAYGLEYCGTVYRWGGDDPVGGFDCSGFVSELLRAFGWLRWNERLTSQQFASRFPEVRGQPEPGDLLVWPGHIAIALDAELMLEAGGGGPATISEGEAAKMNAFVRIRPISMRPAPSKILRLD